MKYMLYAEDDSDDQDLMREMMKRIDPSIQVCCVNNGALVLEFLSNLKDGDFYPCLIVLDGNMPKLNGFDTLSHLKSDKRYADIPVVLYSTSNSQRDIATSKAAGALDFVTKPITYEMLRKVIKMISDFCHNTFQSRR